MRKLRRALLGVVPLVLFGSLIAVQDTQIRVDVEAVNVVVTVTDKAGRFVTDLTRDRFLIYEDGVPQEITSFSRQSDLPLRIGLLIDTSSSVRLKLGFEKDAATNFIRSVMRRNDQALLVEFDEGVSLLHDFTSKPAEIVSEIEKLRAGGGTALFDAIYLVTRDKMRERGARKTLVLVSDGEDLHSSRTPEETLEMIHISEVTIYAIGTNKFGASSSRKGEEILTRLTKETGGAVFFPYSAEKLEAAFDQINQELRSQYTVAYTPRDTTRDGRFRSIEVRLVEGKEYDLRYRRGYRLPDY